MSTRTIGLPLVAWVAVAATAALALGVISQAQTGVTIRVWKIGSPHNGNIPPPHIPSRLRQEATRRGVSIAVEAFPAKGFASTFHDAVTRNAGPDVLVFDNFGLVDGIRVGSEKFDGIAEDPTIRRDLIQVTGAFDEFLGPARGWTYLYSPSRNHAAARALALTTPECPDRFSLSAGRSDLMDVVLKVATAYLEGDAILETYSDPDRLQTVAFRQDTVRLGTARPCGLWGNGKLAFASVSASYDAETAIGHTRMVMVFRKPTDQWQLLVAARDPISNSAFITQAPSVTALLERDGPMGAFPMPATLLSPPADRFPEGSRGQRFGTFIWQSSPSDDVVAEIGEFAYKNDARLFFRQPVRPGSRGQISAGQLWTTRGAWNWRIWSIARSGDLAFSDARTFVH